MIASVGNDLVDRDYAMDLIDVLGDLIPPHPRIGHRAVGWAFAGFARIFAYPGLSARIRVACGP